MSNGVSRAILGALLAPALRGAAVVGAGSTQRPRIVDARSRVPEKVVRDVVTLGSVRVDDRVADGVDGKQKAAGVMVAGGGVGGDVWSGHGVRRQRWNDGGGEY